MADGYKSVSHRGFGSGLNLSAAVDTVAESEAIDALNVIFTTKDAVQQRWGFAKLSAVEGTNRYDSLTPFYKADGTKQLMAGAGNRLEALNSSGTIIASSVGPTASPHYFQRFGGPTAEHLYIANGADTVRRWDGAAFSTPVYTGVTPTGRFLGLSSADNRLVSARFSGSAAGNNPSTVRFSDEGNPTSFTATSYVDLTPGDGEEIMGVAYWRNQVFVFKSTKFFVFYGNSPDDAGGVDFNYRPVEVGVGLAASRALAVTDHGVYFMDRAGIYLTTGTDATPVGANVEPIFHGGSSVYYQGGTLNHAAISACAMTYHDERLWFSFPAGTSTVNNRNLVFSPAEKWWSLQDIPAGPMCVFRPSNVDELVFGYSSGLKHLGRHVEGAYLNDDGVAITARWQGGWFDFGQRAVKTIREMKLAGTGLVTVSIFRDYRQSPSITKQIDFSPAPSLYNSGLVYNNNVLYGPSQLIQPKPLRKAARGEVFSIGLANSVLNRSFKMHRLTMHVREGRVPSVVKVT